MPIVETFDAIDRRILREVQRDATLSDEALGVRVGLSRNACWRRLRRLREAGVIAREVAILDAAALGLDLAVFIAVKAGRHSADWLEAFQRAVREIPEITGVWRTTGEVDYLIRAALPGMEAYDALYRRLIARVELSDVSASFVMERIKETTELPV